MNIMPGSEVPSNMFNCLCCVFFIGPSDGYVHLQMLADVPIQNRVSGTHLGHLLVAETARFLLLLGKKGYVAKPSTPTVAPPTSGDEKSRPESICWDLNRRHLLPGMLGVLGVQGPWRAICGDITSATECCCMSIGILFEHGKDRSLIRGLFLSPGSHMLVDCFFNTTRRESLGNKTFN